MEKANKDGGAGLTSAGVGQVNQILIQSERELTDPRGLPKRAWFEHLIYAPGYYTGYAVKTIPGVREAIEQKQWAEADQEIGRVSGALGKIAQSIDAAAAELEKVAP